MIRIVGLQRGTQGQDEFVLLQNQGGMRVVLRGHVLLAEDSIDGGELLAFAFPDDVAVMPGNYVLLKTAPCLKRWCMGPEGHRVYYTSMGKSRSYWSRAEGALHLLAPQHTFGARALEPSLA